MRTCVVVSNPPCAGRFAVATLLAAPASAIPGHVDLQAVPDIERERRDLGGAVLDWHTSSGVENGLLLAALGPALAPA